MSEQDRVQLRPLFHSDDNIPGSWNAHWRQHGQPWRTEQEIDRKRQEELAQYRAIMPDIEKGIYPFKGVKLSRADVEWLLATHENGRGPVAWNDKSQRTREGLDLRGADLGEADLHRLPLACLRAGLKLMEGSGKVEEKRNAAMLLKGVDLSEACLQKAILNGANLNGANLAKVRLEKATLIGASIKHVFLEWANLGDVPQIP